MNVSAGSRETMIPDIEGSIIGLLDSGGALSKSGYQPYGENPAVVSGTFRYTARRFDPETAGSTSQPSGLYYYRARMYSPTWGRFPQPDPIGYAGGPNLYAYVNNDPLNLIDPLGTCDNPQGCGGSRTGSLLAGGGALAIGATAACVAAEPCGVGEAIGICTAIILGGTAVLMSGDIPQTQSGAQAGTAATTGTNNEPLVTVQHFTNEATMNLIVGGGNVLRQGSYVTFPGAVLGMTSSQIEQQLEISAGRGTWSTTFQTPQSNLVPAPNGATTSGGAVQFVLKNPALVGPWAPTPQ